MPSTTSDASYWEWSMNLEIGTSSRFYRSLLENNFFSRYFVFSSGQNFCLLHCMASTHFRCVAVSNPRGSLLRELRADASLASTQTQGYHHHHKYYCHHRRWIVNYSFISISTDGGDSLRISTGRVWILWSSIWGLLVERWRIFNFLLFANLLLHSQHRNFHFLLIINALDLQIWSSKVRQL